jgi:hypothetical protein
MEERRRLERFELNAPAKVIVQTEGGPKEALDLTTKDVSSGGAFLFSSQPFTEGSNVKMELVISLDMLRKLAGEKKAAKIKVKGRVIRVDAEGIAIRFDSSYKITALENGNNKNNSF